MIVLSARRTFWEKATALHAEAHRPAGSPTPQYFSRHYYDLAMLLDTDEGKAAATDLDLLAQVANREACQCTLNALTQSEGRRRPNLNHVGTFH